MNSGYCFKTCLHFKDLIIEMLHCKVNSQHDLNGLLDYDCRVDTFSKSYPIVIGMILKSLKSIGQFQNA